jgi:murein DD-endopeptidase MepM/ murein hydrolase activator NlpD
VTFESIKLRVSTVVSTIDEFLNRFFVPREIFLRTNGQVQYLQVPVRLQQMIAAASVVVIAWAIFASGSFFVHGYISAKQKGEIERHKLAYFELLTEVTEYHNQFARITRDLEENQAFLLQQLEQDPDAARDIAAIESQLNASETERERVVVARDGLDEKLRQFETDLLDIADRNVSLQIQVTAMKQMLHSTLAERSEVAEARERLGRKLEQVERELAATSNVKQQLEVTVAELHQSLGQSEENRTALLDVQNDLQQEIDALEGQLEQSGVRELALGQKISEFEVALSEANQRGNSIEQQRDTLDARVVALNQRIVLIGETQQELIERLRNQTELSVEKVEKTVAMTGLDLNNLLAQVSRGETAQGGPFIADTLPGEPNKGSQLEMSLSVLDLKLDRWASLQDLMGSLPLSAPLEQYRISSSYGSRADPVNGRKAKHQGMDFGAPMRTSVFATAPGKVVFAGWRGHYGRMVEIDHGYGIRTRYAHLRKILVKAGEVIANRHKIALLGSSGRSTGPHVHYEIRFNGKPFDPAKFLMAGKYVFKG